jgi:integrase
VVRDEPRKYRICLDPSGGTLVCSTANGSRLGASNIRKRILEKAIDAANLQLAANGIETLPHHLTPHSLRRTFASLLFALGETPPYVMAQMEHTTANLTLTIYARQMDRRDGEPERLKALVEGAASSPVDQHARASFGHDDAAGGCAPLPGATYA